MSQLLFIFALISLSGSLINSRESDFSNMRFAVWNVGQGQWTTLISDLYCDHFDMGGEFDLSAKVIRTCSHRQHRLHISHWDWDHMGLIAKMRKKQIALCLWNYPLGSASEHKKIILQDLPACQANRTPIFDSIFAGDLDPKASSNDSSQVIMTHQILVPGDSTIKEEKKWRLNPKILSARGIVLGHHGSRTGTSSLLLRSLPNLSWAIASARKKRYGHPHSETLERLRNHKTPVLRTEDWGSIVFEL